MNQEVAKRMLRKLHPFLIDEKHNFIKAQIGETNYNIHGTRNPSKGTNKTYLENNSQLKILITSSNYKSLLKFY